MTTVLPAQLSLPAQERGDKNLANFFGRSAIAMTYTAAAVCKLAYRSLNVRLASLT